MATTAKAKEALEVTLVEYKRCKSRVKKALESPAPNVRSLTGKMKQLSDALSQLNIHHTLWVTKAGFTEEQLAAERFSANWLESEWGEVDDLADQIDDLSMQDSQRDKHSDADSITILRSQIETLKSDISTKLAQLLTKTTPSPDSALTLSSSCVTAYKEILAGVATDLQTNFTSLSDKLLLLDKANTATYCTEFEQFRRDQQSNLTTLQLRLAEAATTPKEVPLKSSVRTLEMEKSIAPTFSGKIIDYPEFKRGWTAVAGVYWDDSNQVEQIKHKVDSRARRIIARCDTMEKVWTALDQEYAREEMVIIGVNAEIKNLLSLNCSVPEYIVELRTYLPVLEDILKSVDGLDHLCSPDRVNLLLTKFDERTLHEWDYFRTKNKGTTYERFFKFLLDRYDAAQSSIARAQSTPIVPLTGTTKNAPNSSVNNVKIADKTECKRCKTWTARDSVHSCPGCGRGTPIGGHIHHCLEHCAAYMQMSPDERSVCIETAKWCPVHLTPHSLADCNMTNDSRYICGVDNCTKHHHKSLHGGTTPFLAQINATAVGQCVHSTSSSDPDSVLFALQTIPSSEGGINTLFDDAANCCLITKDAAKSLNLLGEPMTMNITTTIGSKSITSYTYKVPLIDASHVQHIITAFEVESISEGILEVDLSEVKHYFSPDVQSQWRSVQDRPTGNLDLLIGANYLGLHPVDYELRDNLRIKKSKFGGFILTGSHPALSSQKILWNDDVNHIRQCSPSATEVSVNRISVKPIYDYFELDSMGVEAPRRCGNCRGCKDCSFRGHMLSQQEQYEYQVMESKVRYDPPTQSFVVGYPFTQEPSILSDNRGQVMKIHERLERKLINNHTLESFNNEFNKMIQNGSLIELSKEEMDMWDGAVHYISLQAVENIDSDTTPMRIVSNSSLSDRKGVSLNSILMKGPNTLSDQWSILNKWRSYEVALCSDVTKAYHSLRTGEVEKHLRRVLWRFGDQHSSWRVFAFCTVSFGDKPAAALLEIAIKKVAELHNDIDPDAAFRIINDRYVDDLASGGSPEEVSRFIGNECGSFQCDGTLPMIMSKGSFKLKAIVASGETNQEKINKLGNKVLGLGWDPCADILSIDLSVALRTCNHTKMILSTETFPSLDTGLLTPRNLLGIVNGVYDPLGLVAPVTTRLRVAFRDLFRNGSSIEWDSPLPPGTSQSLWLHLIEMLVSAGKVTFYRSTKPANVIGQSQVICFFDGSDVAFAAAIYIRWPLLDGDVHVSLLCAKSRVTPLQRISTPRSELNGAVLAARLLLSCLRSLSHTQVVPEKVWFIGDSECTLASLEKVDTAFGEYFGNRVGEVLEAHAKIQSLTKSEIQLVHVPSKYNAADLPTRLDCSIVDIDLESVWQCGPAFLRKPPHEWPVNRDFANRKDQLVPQFEILKKFRCVIQNVNGETTFGIHVLIDPFSTNQWHNLLRRTQLVMSAVQTMKSGQRIFSPVKDAKHLWFLSAMGETVQAQKAGKLRELDIQDLNGLRVVYGRASTGLQYLLGSNYLPVIMASTRLAYLIMLDAHCKDHAGRDVTMAMSRHEAWIINAKRLAKKVVKDCIRCRFLRKQLEGQKMAVLPKALQLPSPPFTNIGLDLIGPITVKAMVNKRATMKVWVTLFVCLNTKAVSMELAPGYSTKDFLLAYSCHVSIRGIPLFVHSDRGSQLVAAHKDLTETPLQYDWDQIADSTSHQGTAWQFAPAGGQWRNGVAEAFVKKFKLSFYHLYKETHFTYAELNTAVKRISNILNDRPVSIQKTRSDVQDEDFLRPLTPNMLLTGRNAAGPPSDYIDVDDPQMRKSFIEDLEAAWWYQFKVQCFDALIPTRKWVDAQRNMAVGDVVLIQYSSKSIPGTYRLGRVTQIEIDQDNLVRTCYVKYRLVKPVTAANRESIDDVTCKEIRVPVQRLVLILPIEEQC